MEKTKVKKNVISNEDLYEAIETILLSSFGVNNLANKSLKLINNKTNDLKDCIIIDKNFKNEYRFKIYLTLNSDIKVTVIVHELQKRLSYELNKIFKINILSVDIYVQNIV